MLEHAGYPSDAPRAMLRVRLEGEAGPTWNCPLHRKPRAKSSSSSAAASNKAKATRPRDQKTWTLSGLKDAAVALGFESRRSAKQGRLFLYLVPGGEFVAKASKVQAGAAAATEKKQEAQPDPDSSTSSSSQQALQWLQPYHGREVTPTSDRLPALQPGEWRCCGVTFHPDLAPAAQQRMASWLAARGGDLAALDPATEQVALLPSALAAAGAVGLDPYAICRATAFFLGMLTSGPPAAAPLPELWELNCLGVQPMQVLKVEYAAPPEPSPFLQ
jgi:hypothetical protein